MLHQLAKVRNEGIRRLHSTCLLSVILELAAEKDATCQPSVWNYVYRVMRCPERAGGGLGSVDCRGPGRFSSDDFGWGDAGQTLNPASKRLQLCKQVNPNAHCEIVEPLSVTTLIVVVRTSV